MNYLFAPPKVELEEDPSTGRATITWYESSLLWRTSNRTILALNSAPWHQTGLRPFVWDYFELEWAHLRLAVARGVTVTQRTGPPGREQNVPIGWNALDPKRYPQVHLHRCQDDGLLGDPDETLDWYSIIGQPQRIEQEKFLFSLTSNDAIENWKKQQKAVQVTPRENGVTFQQIGGYAEVDVTLSNPGKPAAYCYDVRPEEWMEALKVDEPADVDPSSTVIRIVHTRDVKIRLRAHEEQKDALIVEACEISKLSDVPPQGFALGKADVHHLRFRRHRIDELIPSNDQPWVIALFELGINFIPVVGVLYDLGQIAYAAYTGKTFFGYDVGEDEILLMGITTAVGLGVTAAGSRSLRNMVRGTKKLEAAAEDATLTQIKRIADSGYIEAVGDLPPRHWDDVLRALDRHLADPVGFPLPKLVDKFTDAVNDVYVGAVERRLLKKVFKADFSGFRDADLAAAYNRYLQRMGQTALDPASWAKAQGKAIHGLPNQLLRRVLGGEFVEVINRAERADVLPLKLTKKHIDAYDLLVARGVEDYGTLKNLRNGLKKKIPGIGKIFEIDHLLEQRFWRNNPNLTTAFDEKGVGMAFLVPKNSAVSREMFIMAGGQRIRYVHKVKTDMLKELIPNGAETLVTVQEMWDAHVHVLRSLGTHESLINGRLVKDFRLMAKQLGQKLDTRFPRPGAMRHTGGWPRFVKDPTTTDAWIRL